MYHRESRPWCIWIYCTDIWGSLWAWCAVRRDLSSAISTMVLTDVGWSETNKLTSMERITMLYETLALITVMGYKKESKCKEQCLSSRYDFIKWKFNGGRVRFTLSNNPWCQTWSNIRHTSRKTTVKNNLFSKEKKIWSNNLWIR